MLLNQSNIISQFIKAPLTELKNLELSVLRLDKVHPVVSGNKIFKLHYFLEEALEKNFNTILTFGGAYSNHLAATAFAAKELGLRSIGIVRGEEPFRLSHTLVSCMNNGMQLQFISRNEYTKKENPEWINELKNQFGECLVIPEGGYHQAGAKGASLIMDLVDEKATHILSAAGTFTTIAGLLLKSSPDQKLHAIPVLKGLKDWKERLHFLTGFDTIPPNFKYHNDFHWGGYARYSDALLEFMNEFYERTNVPSDFVYTAKMFYACFELIRRDHFPPGSRIVCIHTGGLQGNQSLPPGKLTFDY